MRKGLSRGFGLLALLASLFVFPGVALAHGDEPVSVLAGPLSWVFMAFGGLVIAGVGLILFVGTGGASERSAAAFEAQTGWRGYLNRMRMFSRNARLYMIHVVGMDVIHGTWEVIFNLYLLAVGFDIAFVGLRILLRSIAVGVMSLPAGLISDRIGRKLSFILGDGVGAITALVAISTANPALILGAAVLGGMFGALHGVSEPAFMAENSEDYERVHLFSVASGTRTAAAIIGSALAGLVPLLLLASEPARLIASYRAVAYAGILIWFASLIPALLLRQAGVPAKEAGAPSLLREVFANVQHPARIWRLTLPSALIGLGAGFALPLMNVYFQEGLGSTQVEIGATFAAGQALLVVASFVAPMVAAKLGEVRAIVFTQLISIPFIVLLGYASEAGAALGSVLAVAGAAYVARITTMNMSGPIRSAFGMAILDPGERGTQVGLEQALWAGLSGGAGFLGAQMMNGGNFRLPFLLMAGFYLVATVLFWAFFAGREEELVIAVEPVV